MTTSRAQITISVLGYLARHLGGPLVEKGIRMRRDQPDHLPPAPGSIVMLGDSITDQGEWSQEPPRRYQRPDRGYSSLADGSERHRDFR